MKISYSNTLLKTLLTPFIVIVFMVGNAFAVSLQEIRDSMEDKGYDVEIEDNVVYVISDDTPVAIALSGGNGDVSYLTYLQDVSSDLLGYEFLNRFNNQIKFGRAYVDGDGDIAIQMDRNSAGGISLENIESDFDVFVLLVEKFKDDLESQVEV